MAPREGFEPPTNRLTADRSTTELPRNSEPHGPGQRILGPPGAGCQFAAAAGVGGPSRDLRLPHPPLCRWFSPGGLGLFNLPVRARQTSTAPPKAMHAQPTMSWGGFCSAIAPSTPTAPAAAKHAPAPAMPAVKRSLRDRPRMMHTMAPTPKITISTGAIRQRPPSDGEDSTMASPTRGPACFGCGEGAGQEQAAAAGKQTRHYPSALLG
jgi:hypothetical protein